MKSETVQVRLDPQLTELVHAAVKRTGLNKSELLRQGLRRGVPEVLRRLGGPGGTLVDALLDMKGLEIPPRRHAPSKRRI